MNMPRAVVLSAALGLSVVEVAVPAVQTPPGLVPLAQSLLGAGVPVALIVERRYLTRAAGDELHNTDPGGALDCCSRRAGRGRCRESPLFAWLGERAT